MKRLIAWSVVSLAAIGCPVRVTAAPSQPLVTKGALMASLKRVAGCGCGGAS